MHGFHVQFIHKRRQPTSVQFPLIDPGYKVFWRHLVGMEGTWSFFPHPCKWQELSCNRQEESADQREQLQMRAV